MSSGKAFVRALQIVGEGSQYTVNRILRLTESHSVESQAAQARTTSLQRYANIFNVALWSKSRDKKVASFT